MRRFEEPCARGSLGQGNKFRAAATTATPTDTSTTAAAADTGTGTATVVTATAAHADAAQKVAQSPHGRYLHDGLLHAHVGQPNDRDQPALALPNEGGRLVHARGQFHAAVADKVRHTIGQQDKRQHEELKGEPREN